MNGRTVPDRVAEVHRSVLESVTMVQTAKETATKPDPAILTNAQVML